MKSFKNLTFNEMNTMPGVFFNLFELKRTILNGGVVVKTQILDCKYCQYTGM